MAYTDVGVDDTESYQVEFTDPSPPRSSSGNNTPLKRRSSSSTFSPSLRRCFSLNYAESRPIQSAEISNRGTLVVPENQTRRSLFPPPVSGSTATVAQSLPPPHPLARTISNPTRLSCVQEKNPVPKTDPNSPCGLPGLGPLVLTTSNPSSFFISIFIISFGILNQVIVYVYIKSIFVIQKFPKTRHRSIKQSLFVTQPFLLAAEGRGQGSAKEEILAGLKPKIEFEPEPTRMVSLPSERAMASGKLNHKP